MLFVDDKCLIADYLKVYSSSNRQIVFENVKILFAKAKLVLTLMLQSKQLRTIPPEWLRIENGFHRS